MRYSAQISSTYTVGCELFTVTAVDNDIFEPYNNDTKNAFFDYRVDRNYLDAFNVFSVTNGGLVYVKAPLLGITQKRYVRV